MSKDIVEEARKYIEEECKKETNFFGKEIYYQHIVKVVKHAKELAEKIGADMEIVELAAWLHDLGSLKGDYESHHLIGAKYAEEWLLKQGYDKYKIEKIKHCIIAHRGSKDIPRESIEAQCVADGDAMSHFDSIPSLFNLALVLRKKNSDDAGRFVKEKLERSWNKLSKDAREIIKPKYEAAMLLLR